VSSPDNIGLSLAATIAIVRSSGQSFVNYVFTDSVVLLKKPFFWTI
jgi:hypothetical protein